MNFSAVILAGGESRRMGCDKAWIEVKGRPLLSRAVATVRRAGAVEVFVSGRQDGHYAGMDCPVLLDLKPGGGPLGGIERALSVMNSPLLLVLAVDLPKMTTVFLRKLIFRCDENIGVVPKLRGELEPLAAIYPKRCHALVLDALRNKRLAARDFAKTCLRDGAVRTFVVAVADCVRFANCNSPGDLPVTAFPRKSRS
jgi:molybdopterin-guanine dinucleotide biosynthesis protein A